MTVLNAGNISGLTKGGLPDGCISKTDMVAAVTASYNADLSFSDTVPTNASYPLIVQGSTSSGTINALNSINFYRSFNMGVECILITRIDSTTTDRYSLRVTTHSTSGFSYRCTDGGDSVGGLTISWIAVGT